MSERCRRHAGEPFWSRLLLKNNLQTPHNVRSGKERRVSPHASCRGSLTLETALVLPVLLCAVAALLSLFSFTAIQGRESRTLMERAQLLAVTTGAAEADPYIRLYDYGVVSLPYAEAGFGSRPVVRKAVVRAWVGYTGEDFFGQEEVFVYVTPNGTVYHRSPDCTYLRLSIRSIPGAGLEEARNRSGGRYAACETCVKRAGPAAMVYVTDYGDRYHNSRSCGGLKRTVMMIPLRDAGGLGACSKCGGR